MASHHSTYELYPRIAYNMRAIQLVSLIIEITLLYLDSERLGMSFLFPATVHAFNIYHTGYRWYYYIDGRYDFKQLLSSDGFSYKLPYIFGVFGSILLAIIAHFMLYVPGLYRILSFASIASAGVVLIYEAFETILGKVM